MELIAQKRTQFGKKNKKLRKNRQVPGVVFGKGLDSVPLTLDAVAFAKVYSAAGETNLVDIKADGDTYTVLIKEVQKHPVSLDVLHVNFHKVNLKEKISADIPVEIIGAEENELIKSGEALPLLLLSDITVEALPTDLPDAFEVDVSKLAEIGAGISIAELNYDRSKVEIPDLDAEELVVKLDYAVQEEEEEEVSEEELLEKLEATEETSEKTEDGDTGETTGNQSGEAEA